MAFKGTIRQFKILPTADPHKNHKKRKKPAFGRNNHGVEWRNL
jgi:hypothetical protein